MSVPSPDLVWTITPTGVEAAGVHVRLPPSHVALFRLLASATGRLGSADLAQEFYTGDRGGPEWADKIIQVRMHQIRARLRAAGLECPIVSVRGLGGGYWFTGKVVDRVRLEMSASTVARIKALLQTHPDRVRATAALAEFA